MYSRVILSLEYTIGADSELVALANRLRKEVEAWLRANHPELHRG
jgi:hypothetical protein